MPFPFFTSDGLAVEEMSESAYHNSNGSGHGFRPSSWAVRDSVIAAAT